MFSDAVIGQSLYDNNFLSDEAFRFYLRDLLPNTIAELWRPHVMIYLDKSPEDCLKTIQSKGKVMFDINETVDIEYQKFDSILHFFYSLSRKKVKFIV